MLGTSSSPCSNVGLGSWKIVAGTGQYAQITGRGRSARLLPTTADSSCAAAEGPDKAVNGSVSGGNTDKWCSLGTNKFIQVDLGSTVHIGSLVVRHAGAGGEDTAWNTRDYDLQTSTDGSTWTTAAQVRANTANVTTTTTNVNARYIRMNVITPTQNTNTAARIYEFEAYS